jgi:hypothetical protein
VTVTVEEFQSAAPAASASGSLPLATTLVSSDFVVVVYSRITSAAGTLTINGSSPTIYNTWLNASRRVQVATVTGLTGSHTLSYTMSSSTQNVVAVYVVRGLTNSAITATSESTWDGITTASNTPETPAAVSVDNGQIVIAVAAITSASGTITFPTSPSPATGWVSDLVGASRTQSIHRIFTTAESAQVGVSIIANTTIAVVMLVIGDAVSVPPLTSTFVGWGNPIF